MVACGGNAHPRLAPVAALPKPTLPSWIASVSPIGKAESLTQIRLIFAKDIAPLSAVADATQTEFLSHLSLEPKLPGQFVLLTPRMIGFIPQRALPAATRVRVTLSAGAKDLAGDTLATDLRWTFHTARIAFTDLPKATPAPNSGDTSTPSPLHPSITITASSAVDRASLAANAVLIASGSNERIGLRVQPPKATPAPNASQTFDASTRTYTYTLDPVRDLARATTYILRIDPGVLPRDGNIATTTVASGSLRTFGPLAIAPTPSPASANSFSSRFVGGDPGLAFTTPIDPKSVKNGVTISPSIAAANPVVVADDPTQLSINPYLLSPNSTYTVTVTPALRDIFGQHFDRPVTQTIHTGVFTPGIWAPTSSAIFPSDFSVGLNIYATNLAGNAYHAAYVPVTEEDMLAHGPQAQNYSPLDATLTSWPTRTISGAKVNVQSIVPVPLAQLIGGNTGALAYGIGVHFGPEVDAAYYGLVQLTNLGIFTQIFPGSGIVRVTHLSDGSPAAHVAVDVRAVNGDHPNTGAKPLCASGTTNASGTMSLSQIDIERCTALARVTSGAPPLLVVARDGADWSWVDLDSYSGIYNYDIPGGWSAGRPLSRGILYPDRDLYKPGESGELSGVAYLLNNDILAAAPHAAYKVVISDPDGNTIRTSTVQTDGYGVFSLPLKFSPNARLGYYSVAATGPAGDTLYGSFRVAEFRAPNFKLALNVAAPNVIAGTTQQATATGSYLFGGALSGAKAVISVTRDVAMIAPSGYDAYTFGRQWFWPQNSPSFDTNVSQTTGTFDAAGKLLASVPVPADLSFPMAYSIDVNATDASNLSVDATQSFTALADADVIGLTGDAVGAAGSPLVMKAVVVSPDGKDVGSRAIHVELQKATFASATQLAGGGESADESVTYATVDSADVQAGAKPTDVTLHPKDAGIYRVRATFAGAKNAAAATDTQVWVSGSSGDFASQYGDRSVAIHLDRKKYNVGDTATALVQSPYPHARVTLDVIRNSVLYETSVDATGSSVRIPFTVTPSMLPNVAVQARVVRTGRPLSQLPAKDVPSTLMRIGMTGLNVAYGDHLLKIGIAPSHPHVEPGGKQTLRFSLTSANGKAASGEIIVAVVNEAILQLTGYRPPTLLDALYAQQPISTRFAQNGQRVVTQMEKAPLAKGWGYGGGFLGGAADARIRHTFTPLAFYSARVRTDARGIATTTFSMPDDLTTWRIMAVAVDGNGRDVGNGDTTFISTKKLITNPLLPQFARPGDRIDGGLTIRNATKAAADATVSITTSGSLHFASGNTTQQSATQHVDIGMQALRYAMVVGAPAPTTYTVRSSLDGDTDAFEIPLPIRDRAVTQTSFDAGSTTDHTSLAIDTAQKASLVLTLANTAVPQFLVPASDVLKAAKWPFADDASGRLVIDTMLKQSTAEDLASLSALHRSDGGFAFTPSDATSDPYATAAALHALAFAKERGVAVSAIPIDATLGYVRSLLADPTRLAYCKAALCRARTRFEMMSALSAWGDHTTSFLEEILANDAQFDAATRMRLARYLLATPNYIANGKQIAKYYLTQTNLSGRYATLNVANPWSWLGGDAQAQAQLVRLAVADGASRDFLDAALRSLASTQCHCGWGGVDGTASALQALAAYQRVAVPHALHIVVKSGATQMGAVDLPATPSSKDLTISSTALTSPNLDISVRGGTLDYIATITAQVPRNAPGALAGLRVTRTLTALGAKSPLVTFDLNPLTATLSVPAAHVFDIGIRVIVDRPLDRVVIDDALPAGFEAIDSAFQTSPQSASEIADAWQIGDRQIYADRVTAYAWHLNPGVYEMHYLVRSVTPGTYAWPGTRASVRGAPEIYGRSSSGELTITQ